MTKLHRVWPAALAAGLLIVGRAAAQTPEPEVAPADAPAVPGEDPEEREVAVPLPPPDAPAPPVYAGDPKAWWGSDLRAAVRVDPLGDRRSRKNDPKVAINNGVPPLLYRLWGLPPLQTMVLRPGEVVLEVWVRPTGGNEEMIARLTVRRDNKVFIQARAGQGCCRPEIARRIDIDQQIDKADAAAFAALGKLPLWTQPPEVSVERPGVVEAVCVKGSAFDVTLLDYTRAAHLRRICENEAVGSVAPVLKAVLGAAMGKDPRFDVLFRGGVDYELEQSLYNDLIREGGKLAPAKKR